METSSVDLVRCENCQTESAATIKFCPQCSFPIGGTDEDKTRFRLLVSSKKRLLSDAHDKIKSAKTWIWVVAGIMFIVGLSVGVFTDDFASMIVDLVLALVFVIMAAWANKNPFGAILTSFIIYITLIVVNMFVDPATLFQGIIFKILIIGAFVKGIRSAQEAQGYLKELEKVKSAPVGID